MAFDKVAKLRLAQSVCAEVNIQESQVLQLIDLLGGDRAAVVREAKLIAQSEALLLRPRRSSEMR